ncbi:hypothetical protein BDZ97DRAFT_1765880 [Flammula alnicola]|nr:hypothetical protein BDZ97DRAFT_1765880 [Flammula alnicola]
MSSHSKSSGTSSNKKVDSAKLAPLNEKQDDLDKAADKLDQEKKAAEDLRIFAESFIKGQGRLYILESGNKAKKDNTIIDNGPKYIEHAWNRRPVENVNIQALFASTGGARGIFPLFQQYAIVVAVSSTYLEGLELAKYQSNTFPYIKFNAEVKSGSVHIINGHHRIAAWKEVHEPFLKQLHDIESILKGLNITSDHDTGDIIEAREQAVKLYEKLYIDGAWGALVLDYDAIQKHSRAEELKAYWARNLPYFSKPDTDDNTLAMVLTSVRTMTKEKGFAFLQDQLKRSDSGSHQKFSTIVKNPDLLFIFADLMAIPMFEKVHLVNFANLYDWRRMTRVWLNVFLKYARDTYRYIAYPAKDPLASIADVMEKSSSSVSYMYGFLDSTFHDIIDEAYKNHLAKAMVAFGIKDGVQVGDAEQANWTRAFTAYREEVLDKLKKWASTAGQFFTLLEPTFAMRFGYKKKTNEPIDLMALLHQIANTPADGIAGDEDWVDINIYPNLEQDIAELWAIPFLHRNTGLLAVQTMQSELKQKCWTPPTGISLKDMTMAEARQSCGLMHSMNQWVKAQRREEIKMTMGLDDDQRNFLNGDGKTRKFGCVLPPALSLMPSVGDEIPGAKEIILDAEDQQVIASCLDILACSRVPWSYQNASNPNQHHISLALSTMQLYNDKASIYHQYLGEDLIWETYTQMLDIIKRFCPEYHPWHGISTEKTRVRNSTQKILEESLHQIPIQPLIAATMAQQVADDNEKYRQGINQIFQTVLSTATFNHEGTSYLGREVFSKTMDLLRTLGKECVNQAFSNEQNRTYDPPEHLELNQLDDILRDRLGFPVPVPGLQIMSTLERAKWYGADGIAKAYTFQADQMYGVKAAEKMQKQKEAKIERAEAAKEKKHLAKTNTPAENNALHRHDPHSMAQGESSVTQPSNTQKRLRGQDIDTIDNPHPAKRGRSQTHQQRASGDEGPETKQKGKQRAKSFDGDSQNSGENQDNNDSAGGAKDVRMSESPPPHSD